MGLVALEKNPTRLRVYRLQLTPGEDPRLRMRYPVGRTGLSREKRVSLSGRLPY